MLSLEQLFCSVDDFCQGFEAQWQQQLLGCGLKLRNRPRSLTKERNHDDSDGIPPIVLPQLQNLLLTEGAD
jgi:hypothetical protein